MSSQQEVFDVINNLYHLVDNNKVVWFYAKELCEYLEYDGLSRQIIKDNISDINNKMEYSKLKRICASFKGAKPMDNVGFEPTKPMDNVSLEDTKQECKGGNIPPMEIHHRELFVNEEALYELINNSSMPKANRFKKWTRIWT
jgi:prophage antirepressor-like protein